MLHKKYFHKLPPIVIQNGPERMCVSCLWTMEGHSSWIGSVAFSPDGTHIMSGSDDKTFNCGMLSAVPFEGVEVGILSRFIQSHSPQMAHVLCLDPLT
jgi:WD domain, G-beta repeat